MKLKRLPGIFRYYDCVIVDNEVGVEFRSIEAHDVCFFLYLVVFLTEVSTKGGER
jgi:hypothetical protein